MDIKPKVNLNGKIKPYFYIINFSSDEESLCKMEMKCLFNKVPNVKHFFSYHYIDPSRSPFIKECISIMYTGKSLEDIIHKITTDNLKYEKFKVSYINYGDETVGYENRRNIEYKLGQNIKGEAEMKNPELIFGVTKSNGKWIFGEYKKSEPDWKLHSRKPYSYSNALNSRVARAIVNIAVCNNSNYKVVDPCCGIGTVIIEALSLGINIKGWEINPMIAANAKINLKYLYYKNVITTGTMHDIKDKFDVSIIDLPYGLFSPTTLKEQVDIMKTARKISNKMVIVTFEDMDKHILSAGFDIIDSCSVSKSKFKRYITICK
ncbi:RNA methyltransferase [Clostridium sp. P21]|uniref:RNA methyltransferase n=2 Tax=Clostridium muellerianum TaxID=2716538 RepID=A0A7Y0EIL2_9CLOT|nr:RNA methyltransferase [Clostridium muellerianum]